MQWVIYVLWVVTWQINAGGNWLGFRGDGTSHSACANLPLHWDANENVALRVALSGYGQSTPVVWGEKVFLTAVRGANKEELLISCLDAGSGELKWQRECAAGQTGKNNPSVSRAAPTSVVDESSLTVFFESGDFIGLDHAGNVRWQRNLAKEFGTFKNHHGIGSSLTQTKDSVIALVEHSGGAYLLAVGKQDGKTLWKMDRQNGLSWASPVVARFGERECIVVSSNGSLAIYDSTNGMEIWSHRGLTGNLIPSVAIQGDNIFVGAGESGLTFDLKAAARSNCAFEVKVKGGTLHAERLWEGEKVVAHHASPLICEGRVYLLTKVGVVHCFDMRNGKEQFTKRLTGPCWTTPIATKDRIYFFGKDGATTVIRVGPTFQELAVNRLWDQATLSDRKDQSKARPESKFPQLPQQGRVEMEAMLDDALGDVVYGVAAANNSFFIRTGNEMICVREQARKN